MHVNNLLTMNYHYQTNMKTSQKAMQTNMERLSSGKRINSAADEPSKMIRMSRLEAQIRGKDVANQNIQDGVSFLQTKDSALNTMQQIGQSLRELAVQYENDSLSKDDKLLIQKEAQSLTEEMATILEETKFNQQSVFDSKNLQIQTGANRSDNYVISGFENRIIGHNHKTKHKEHIEGFYDFSLNNESGNPIFSDRFSIEIRDGDDTHIIRLQDGNNVNEGTLTMKDSKSGIFQIDVQGNRYEGELRLGKNSDITKLNTDNEIIFHKSPGSFPIDESFSGNFHLQNEVIHREAEPYKEAVSFKNVDKLNINTVLNTDFIDKNILDPIAKERSQVGIEQSILGKRLEHNQSQNVIQQQTLSNIEDVDVAKEMMEKVKNELLTLTNVSLIQDINYQHRNYISQLLG